MFIMELSKWQSIEIVMGRNVSEMMAGKSEDEINMAVGGIYEKSPSIDFTGNDVLRAFDSSCQIDSASRVRQRFRC